VIRILFWNTGKQDLTKHICELARDTQATVIVLSEFSADAQVLLAELRKVDDGFHIPTHMSERFTCFCRVPSVDFSEIHEAWRLSVRSLSSPAGRILVGLVHGPDQINYDSPNRQSVAQSLADEMRLLMERKSSKRVMLLGDFNLNPFDESMNLAMIFNAMMTKSCTSTGVRRFGGKDYDFFYNPMWGLLGDKVPGPPGTAYDRSGRGPYGWSMPDQVILHHALIPEYVDVEILDRAGALSLVDKMGRPDKNNASDHLPIIVSLA